MLIYLDFAPKPGFECASRHVAKGWCGLGAGLGMFWDGMRLGTRLNIDNDESLSRKEKVGNKAGSYP